MISELAQEPREAVECEALSRRRTEIRTVTLGSVAAGVSFQDSESHLQAPLHLSQSWEPHGNSPWKELGTDTLVVKMESQFR